MFERNFRTAAPCTEPLAADGEIVEGLASIDESAVTGESAPVIREAGGDKSSVTGGTKVLSDRILVKVTARPGESFLDKMIALVEGSSRQKTPNEIALTILLAGFTIVFVIVCATLKPFADYVGANITIAAFISLFVCLIPTTIGGLLSAIGIAGMDRALRANVITKSGKAVETAGDIDTLLLDKTGTITIGNRKATAFHPAQGYGVKEFTRLCVLSSVSDQTPEGKSVVELGAEMGMKVDPLQLIGVQMVQFTAETKCSGVDMPDGRRIRKGASEAILRIAAQAGNKCPAGIEETVRRISENGGTPLIVSENEQIRGVIELQDIIKTGIRERFERLRKMGVKTVMVTGDNPLTAKYIAEKAGVDDFIAEARPEDKLEYIRREQRSGKLVAMMGDGTNDARDPFVFADYERCAAVFGDGAHGGCDSGRAGVFVLGGDAEDRFGGSLADGRHHAGDECGKRIFIPLLCAGGQLRLDHRLWQGHGIPPGRCEQLNNSWNRAVCQSFFRRFGRKKERLPPLGGKAGDFTDSSSLLFACRQARGYPARPRRPAPRSRAGPRRYGHQCRSRSGSGYPARAAARRRPKA